jgi:hypothetical protein
MDARERAAVERDRSVALCRDGARGARSALLLLETALTARSDDTTAWECKGHALAGCAVTAKRSPRFGRP